LKFNIKKVKKMFLEKGITDCEVRLPGCENSWLTFAHRYKRRFYPAKGDINGYDQIVMACMKCHQKMEQDKDLTKEVFNRLRP